MNHLEGPCVGCNTVTTETIESSCTQDIFACESRNESWASLRCTTCREREQLTVYACLDFQHDPEFGRDTGGWLPVAEPIGGW